MSITFEHVVLVLIVMLPSRALAADTDVRAAPAYDNALSPAAALPAAGTTRAIVGVASASSELSSLAGDAADGSAPASGVAQGGVAQGGVAQGSVSFGALWAFAPRFAVAIGTSVREARVLPGVEMRWQPLSQSSAPVDATVSVRYRAQGFEAAGPSLAASLTVGRTFGRLGATVHGVLGRGIGPRQDVDAEGAARLALDLGRGFEAAGEAHVRGELVETYVTAEDEGRPVGVLAGAGGAYRYGPLRLVALGGWAWPRGPWGSGPAAFATTSFDF